jgi:hypothetical protein
LLTKIDWSVLVARLPQKTERGVRGGFEVTNEEPYWVRYQRELHERNAETQAKRNPPPPKATSVVPLLRWKRTITWWPKYEWERYNTITHGDDLSPADKGRELMQIQDLAVIGNDDDDFPGTSVEVSYHPYICEERPQDCGYIIIHKADTPAEEVVCEDGFNTIDDAKRAATQALAHVLQRSRLR